MSSYGLESGALVVLFRAGQQQQQGTIAQDNNAVAATSSVAMSDSHHHRCDTKGQKNLTWLPSGTMHNFLCQQQ